MMKTRQMVWRMGAAFLIVASCALGADEDALPDLDMDWLATGSIGDDSSPWSGITPVGRVTRVDGEYIESEDRVAGTRERRERAPGVAILLKLHGAREDAAALCAEVRRTRRARDHLWLGNGDEFPCEFFELNKRFARLRAFDVDLTIPRGRVAAIRFRDEPENLKNEGRRNVAPKID
jgi:hypothetical protein